MIVESLVQDVTDCCKLRRQVAQEYLDWALRTPAVWNEIVDHIVEIDQGAQTAVEPAEKGGRK